MKRISVVVPTYNEELNIQMVYDRVTAVFGSRFLSMSLSFSLLITLLRTKRRFLLKPYAKVIRMFGLSSMLVTLAFPDQLSTA